MPKGGCSKTPQPEDFSLSNDMVEKQTGKKVVSASLGCLQSCCPLALASSGCISISWGRKLLWAVLSLESDLCMVLGSCLVLGAVTLPRRCSGCVDPAWPSWDAMGDSLLY